MGASLETEPPRAPPNPPCALAPRENRIRTRILAGEKTPRLRLIAGADGPVVVAQAGGV